MYMYSKYLGDYLSMFTSSLNEHNGIQQNTYNSFFLCMYAYIPNNVYNITFTAKMDVHWV